MSPGTEQPTTLGIDIGGTKTQGIVLDGQARVIADRRRRTATGPAGVLATALAVARDCLQLAGVRQEHLGSVGVGIPGRVDHRTGVVSTAVNLGIGRLELGSALSAELRVPVQVDNDVKATALGAADYLRAGDADLTYLNLGTGVASATLIGGRLVRGDDNLAGEIGHVPIDPGAGRRACGQRGCIEVLAGGAQIAGRLAALGSGLTLRTLVSAAEAGDPAADDEVRRIAEAIATAVQLLVLAHGSTRVALGVGWCTPHPDWSNRAGGRSTVAPSTRPSCARSSCPPGSPWCRPHIRWQRSEPLWSDGRAWPGRTGNALQEWGQHRAKGSHDPGQHPAVPQQHDPYRPGYGQRAARAARPVGMGPAGRPGRL